jgi:hypothetical protein
MCEHAYTCCNPQIRSTITRSYTVDRQLPCLCDYVRSLYSGRLYLVSAKSRGETSKSQQLHSNAVSPNISIFVLCRPWPVSCTDMEPLTRLLFDDSRAVAEPRPDTRIVRRWPLDRAATRTACDAGRQQDVQELDVGFHRATVGD